MLNRIQGDSGALTKNGDPGMSNEAVFCCVLHQHLCLDAFGKHPPVEFLAPDVADAAGSPGESRKLPLRA